MFKIKISQGVFYAFLSVLLYSISASIVKFLSHRLPVMEVVFFRGIISLVIVLGYMIYTKKSFKIVNKRFWALRGFVGAFGQVIYIYLISIMKLADIMTITLITPIFVAFFARIFLKEKVSKWFLLAFILAMFGALLVVKPGLEYTTLSLLLGFTMTILAGIAYVTTRFLTRNNSVFIIVLSFILFSLLYSTPFVIYNFVVPTSRELVGILFLGTIVTGAMLTLAHAYSKEDTSSAVISMISYFKIIFGITLGFIFWQELPDYLSIIGTVIIVFSTLLLKASRRRSTVM